MRSPCCYALLWLVGCGTGADHQAAATRPAPKAPPPTAASAPGPESAGGIRWDIAAPLQRRESKSPVRAAEYGVQGDPRAELVVFHFGEQKVSIEAQIQGWLIQVEQADGSDTAQKAKRSERTLGPLTIHTVEVSGNYTGPVTTSALQLEPSDGDWILLGAIVSGPKGPVMFKFTGPRASVERARAAYEQLLQSVRPE